MKISVIVPTYNRCDLLKRTLESLFQQDYPDYEIIVVNDGSTDGTDEYVSRLANERKIRYVKQSQRGPAAARNAGLRVAHGLFTAYTDDDCMVPSDWLRRFAEAFQQTGADIIGGTAKNCIENNIYSEVSQEITNYFVEILGRNDRSSAFLPSNNVAYRTEAIKRAGGFDERFQRAGGEERALHYRMIQNGSTSLFLPDLIVGHYHELDRKSFFRQQRNYGRGSYILYRIVGKDLSSVPKPIPLSAYGTLLFSFFRTHPLMGIIKAALFIAGQIMVAIGFLQQAATLRQPACGGFAGKE